MTIRNLLLATAAASAMAFSGAAYAADVYAPPPEAPYVPPAEAFSWTGLYFGLHGGYAWGHADANNSIVDLDVDGPFVGGQIGFNWQIGSLVLGLEGDGSWAGIDGIDPGNLVPQTTVMEIDWMASARARAGFAMGQFMPYITGGFVWAGGTRTSSSGGGQTATNTHTGWTAGAGIEYMITHGWSTGLEYRYVSLGRETYDFGVGLDPNVAINLHTIRFTVNKIF